MLPLVSMKAPARHVKRLMAIMMIIVLVGLAESVPRRTHDMPLRVAVGLWPGSETFLMARERGLLPESRFTFLEATWPSAAYRAFDSGAVDAAVLTGEDVGRLLSSGKGVRVVCFMDESMGADALVAPASVRTIADLKGKRVGFAPHGPGFHLFSEALAASGLTMKDVEAVSLLQPDIPDALLRGEVSGVIATEPWIQEMVAGGAHVLMNSSELRIPIFRLLVVKEAAMKDQREELVDLVGAHFAMVTSLQSAETDGGIATVLQRQHMSRERFLEMMSTIRIFDREENDAFMMDASPAMADILNPVDPGGAFASNGPVLGGAKWRDQSILNEAAP